MISAAIYRLPRIIIYFKNDLPIHREGFKNQGLKKIVVYNKATI